MISQISKAPTAVALLVTSEVVGYEIVHDWPTLKAPEASFHIGRYGAKFLVFTFVTWFVIRKLSVKKS